MMLLNLKTILEVKGKSASISMLAFGDTLNYKLNTNS